MTIPDFTPNTDPVENWTPCPLPPREAIEGRFCRVEPLDADRHATELFQANTRTENWEWLGYGPFKTKDAFRAWMAETCTGEDPLFHAIIDKATDKAVGVASYLRITPEHGSIEVGHINYSPLLQRHPAGTEAMYLLMRRAFGMGYRRYEWKCNAANAPSRAAALRYGFTFEGVFRSHMISRGCNRDTAWFSILDSEWSHIRARFEAWLSPDNFDAAGRQRQRLADFLPPLAPGEGSL